MEAFLLLILVSTAIFLKKGAIVSPHKLFSLFFLMTYFGWYIFVQAINLYVDYKQSDEIVSKVLLITTLFYFTYFVFYSFLCRMPRIVIYKKVPLISNKTIHECYKYFLLIGGAGLLLYIAKNGFVLLKVHSGGYEQKNIANAGSGIARILYSVGFGYFIACRLIVKPNEIIRTLCYSIVLGVLIFVSIGGGRASSLMPFATCIFYLIWSGKISIIKSSIVGVSFFMLIIATTFIRYNISSENIDDTLIGSVLYKLQGSFSPADSAGVLVENYDTFSRFPDAILNNFLYFIPRLLWSEKPIILPNAAGYFTNEILAYPVELTISPTLVGELLIYGGYLGVFIGAICTALFIRFYDVLYDSSRKDSFFKAWYLVSFASFFALMREGLALVMRDLILSIIISIFVVFTFHFINSILSRLKRNC